MIKRFLPMVIYHGCHLNQTPYVSFLGNNDALDRWYIFFPSCVISGIIKNQKIILNIHPGLLLFRPHFNHAFLKAADIESSADDDYFDVDLEEALLASSAIPTSNKLKKVLNNKAVIFSILRYFKNNCIKF